jgi:hypothetical protein
MNSDAEHFLRGLADHGGQIVSTAYCTEGEISLARVEDRFYVDKDGFGYVRLPKGGCTKPPAGWRCTRKQNHDGPCAAIPID